MILILKSESEMLRTPNFGRKSLNEIKEVLAQMGLHLGMHIPNWPPENIEELALLSSRAFLIFRYSIYNNTNTLGEVKCVIEKQDVN